MSRPNVRWVRRGAVAVAALLVAGFAVGSLAGSNSASNNEARSAPKGPAAISRDAQGAALPVSPGAVSGGTGFAADSRAGTAATHNAGPLGSLTLAAAPDNVIKTGEIALQVRRGRIDSAWQRVFQIAQANGGYVLSSGQGGPIPLVEGDPKIAPFPSGAEDDPRFADVVIRVPADKFEAAVAALTNGDLGKVTRRGFSGQDVSQEFVDLESRLRHLRAQEGVLLKLMAKATSIGDTIAVQQQLSQVQLQSEEISGRIRYLKNQTSLATISVHLAETGAAPAGDGPSFTKAWDTAVEGLERMGTAALIGATWLSPFIILAVAWAATRRFRARPIREAPQI